MRFTTKNLTQDIRYNTARFINASFPQRYCFHNPMEDSNCMSHDELQHLKFKLRDFADERDWEQFHSPKNLSMALIAEAAELVEHFQWLSEAESRIIQGDKLEKVKYELADIFIYLVRIADKLDVDLYEAAEQKMEINEEKYPSDKVKGQHKKYTDYD